MRAALLASILAAVVLVAPQGVSPVLGSYATNVLRSGLPSRTLTPGATNPVVTQATIHRTICVSGWTSRVRPPSSYTTALKQSQLVTYGYANRSLSRYEEDHLIPLELGGSPSSPRTSGPNRTTSGCPTAPWSAAT